MAAVSAIPAVAAVKAADGAGATVCVVEGKVEQLAAAAVTV